MKVVVLYRPKSEYARIVETFIHDFQGRHASVRLEKINVDERDGIAMASLYDVVQFPTILAMTDEGVLLQFWQGGTLPLMDEVASYALR